MNPGDLVAAALFAIVILPVAPAVLAFMPDDRARAIGRWGLALAWLVCGALVIACIWASTRESSGIGSGVFVLVAFVPAIPGLVWFIVWKIARRRAYLDSLPPEERRVEELGDVVSSLESIRRDLPRKRSRANSFWVSSKERKRLRTEIAMMEMMLPRLEAERERLSRGSS
jgi:hypothetical protein